MTIYLCGVQQLRCHVCIFNNLFFKLRQRLHLLVGPPFMWADCIFPAPLPYCSSVQTTSQIDAGTEVFHDLLVNIKDLLIKRFIESETIQFE